LPIWERTDALKEERESVRVALAKARADQDLYQRLTGPIRRLINCLRWVGSVVSRQRRRSAGLVPISISVLTPVYRPVPEHLAQCLTSVARQTGLKSRNVAIQHVVVDDGSNDPGVDGVLEANHAAWRLIRRRAANGGIVAASNDALSLATGEWVVMLDHDDVLAVDALVTVAEAARAAPNAVVVYSDHDIIRADGRYVSPFFKPDLPPERLRHTNYITHLVAVRRDRLIETGGFRPGTDGAQDHDILLRMLELGLPFVHVPRILLHWRQSPASVASDPTNKPEAFGRVWAESGRHLDCGALALRERMLSCPSRSLTSSVRW